MKNILDELTTLLAIDDRLVSEGKLMKNKIIELSLTLDSKLLKLLLSQDNIKNTFFATVGDVIVFDSSKFQKFISNKQFLPDSYTAYKNKIGLYASETYIKESNDVVLAWAYKDCVLEGGQTKDDVSRKEIFWNETLAPDEIDRLLSPKILSNWRTYDKDGVKTPSKISTDGNLIIKGNNLLALHSLKPFFGKIKLICIDPPYNTGKDDFNYNDTFNKSSWLTFMKSRLEVSKRLLDKNGTMFIFCDDHEQAYLKVLCDEIMGRECFITTIVWKHSDNSNNDAKQFSTDHNYILVYSRNENWVSLKNERGEENASHYKNEDGDPRGPWFDGNPLNSPKPRPNLKYKITAPNGNVIEPPTNGWRWDTETLKEKMDSGEIYFNEKQTNIKRRTYLWEQKSLPPSTLWEVEEESSWFDLDETGHTRQAKSEQKKLFKDFPTSELFKTPKPEKVIQKIISISTIEGDYVLDYFSGSGTTAATAMKMNRKFIAVEQMDYIETFTIPRLQKVIAGEKGGITKDVDWKGGGSFTYCELAQANQRFVDRILEATKEEKLLAIWEELK
jgi:adenine-specific DNA-methyltransferase